MGVEQVEAASFNISRISRRPSGVVAWRRVRGTTGGSAFGQFPPKPGRRCTGRVAEGQDRPTGSDAEGQDRPAG